MKLLILLAMLFPWAFSYAENATSSSQTIGRETAIARHIKDDEEFSLPLADLIEAGKKLFNATWTEQEGGGRPLTKGNGKALSDPKDPLVGSRGFNRISGPDANSCAGCHNQPYGLSGGGGDFVSNVFVLGQRFDFATLDPKDTVPTKGAVDERSQPVSLNNIANLRATTGMFGAGYIEMLAREITEDLQGIRDGMRHGESRALQSKGINFGTLTRRKDGMWDVSKVVGLPRASILTATPQDPPSLVIRPWHQAGNAVSLREFSNTALNQHHGIQTTERFGLGTDPDGDSHNNEMTRGDVTAISLYQAVLQVPGRVIPNDPTIQKAISNGEKIFAEINCAACHIPALPLSKRNWVYTEPNPFNPPMNLRQGEIKSLKVDLTDPSLPQPRIKPDNSDSEWLLIPVFTDFKLHDITDPKTDYGTEPLDQNQTVWSAKFVAGNRKFLTKRLWGCANDPPYFHHGLFTTLRQAILSHYGEADRSRRLFIGLSDYDKDSLIEFLKTLQVLPPGTKEVEVDEYYHNRKFLQQTKL